MAVRKKDIPLQTYLEQLIWVQLGEKRKRMSRRKAYIFRHALKAARGNLASLQLVIQIAQKGE